MFTSADVGRDTLSSLRIGVFQSIKRVGTKPGVGHGLPVVNKVKKKLIGIKINK